EEAAHGRTRDEDLPMEARPDVRLAELPGQAHGADDRDPRAQGEVLHRGVVYGTGGVVDIDVHAAPAGFLDGCNEVGSGPIVDDLVVADLPAPCRLFRGAGDTHGPASGEPGKLPGDLPHGAGCSRYEHRVAGPRGGAVVKREVRGHAVHAERV